MMKQLLVLIALALLSINAFSQPDVPPHAQPGKCYAKCLLQEANQTIEKQLCMYTGNAHEAIDLDTLFFGVDVTSGDLFAVPAKVDIVAPLVQYIVVRDTSQTKAFEHKSIRYRASMSTQAITDWEEVVCGDKINRKLLNSLQDKLRDAGFLASEKNDKKLGTEVKTALKNYQRKYGLPIGNLDMKTMRHLGIRV